MGVVGQWDGELLERFRRERDPDMRRRIFGELARVHAPLVVRLVKQALRDPRAGGAWRLGMGGFERGIPKEALSAGDFAFARWLPEYDPSRGTLATFLKLRVLDEVQKAIQDTGIVRRGRKQRVAEAVFLEQGDELEVEEPGESGADLREAIARFLEEHFRFAAAARVAANEVRGRYESVVVAGVAARAGGTGRRQRVIDLAREGAHPRGGELVSALLARGARRSMVRVPWAAGPVRGFAGVRLQIDGGPGRDGFAQSEAGK
jgi:hypothetical protein